MHASAALLAGLLLLALMLPSTGAATPEGPLVNQLAGDPVVRVAHHRHCVRSSTQLRPRYAGGGGFRISRLFINGRQVAARRSSGPLRISAARLKQRVNRWELVSEFKDGRAASSFGTLRRCG